jgi:hypothetical protein
MKNKKNDNMDRNDNKQDKHGKSKKILLLKQSSYFKDEDEVAALEGSA